MEANTSLSVSAQNKSSQTEPHLVAGEQQLPEITPASVSAAVEGVKLQPVDVQPRASGTESLSRSLQLTLAKDIYSGDLASVSNFLNKYSFPLTAPLLTHGTVLHAAVIAGHLKIVELLLNFISEEDLHVTDYGGKGNTAMGLAALSGNTEIVECLFKRNKKLVTLANWERRTPLMLACVKGHKNTTRYLYSVTPFEFLLPENGNYGSTLLSLCIWVKQFDIALDLIRQCPALAFTQDQFNWSPIIRLADESSLYLDESGLVLWQRWVYSCLKVKEPSASTYTFTYIPGRAPSEGKKSVINQVARKLLGLSSSLLIMFGIKQIYDIKSNHAFAMELLRRITKYTSTLDKEQLTQGGVDRAMFQAAWRGNKAFIIEMCSANSDLIFVYDNNWRDIFKIATIFRQEKVFSLIYGLNTLKETILNFMDARQNSLLHLAAELGPDSQAKLSQISGAALQMQRELQWFKEVKSILPEVQTQYGNEYNKTAQQVFDETHKDLRKQGEEWMKQLASSSTVVATLIMTIMFAAAFTVPGGNDQNIGFPIFLTTGHKHEVAFLIFITSDAISLFASSTSVLMFLGILTSRYAMEDFLTSLPNKLIISLSSLFISLATMMVAFCASLVIMLQGRMWIIIPIILLASIPITLFVWLQFPLLVKTIVSTYGAGIFDRKIKPWI